MSAYGIALIGVRVKKEQLSKARGEPITRDGCHHRIPVGANYCPVCGAPRTVVEPAPEMTRERLESLVKPFAVESDGSDRDLFVAAKPMTIKTLDICSCGSSLKMDLPDRETVGEYKSMLRKMLEPIGCWDEKSFGVWVVGECLF